MPGRPQWAQSRLCSIAFMSSFDPNRTARIQEEATTHRSRAAGWRQATLLSYPLCAVGNSGELRAVHALLVERPTDCGERLR